MVILDELARVPEAALRRLSRLIPKGPRPVILMYHRIADDSFATKEPLVVFLYYHDDLSPLMFANGPLSLDAEEDLHLWHSALQGLNVT